MQISSSPFFLFDHSTFEFEFFIWYHSKQRSFVFFLSFPVNDFKRYGEALFASLEEDAVSYEKSHIKDLKPETLI